MKHPTSVSNIVQSLGGELIGNGDTSIAALASLERASTGAIGFLNGSKYRSLLSQSAISCVILRKEELAFAQDIPACIVHPDPYLYYAKLSQWWAQRQGLTPIPGFIHPSAVIDEHAQVHPSAYIGPLCVLEAHVSVGANSILHARVYLGSRCSIGTNCIVHAGAVIGADGFGFANTAENFSGEWVKIAQIGAVAVGNDVEIGANTCIDRGTIDDTVIENGVKIDNLVQIAHNVRIGKHSAIAGQAGIAGSTNIGAHCTIGGSSGVVGHITLSNNTHISAGSSVAHSIPTPGQYTGMYPVQDHKTWKRNAAVLTRLSELRERVRSLEKLIRESVDDSP